MECDAMAAKRVLYISGSFGLGHIYRDLAIARELRNENPEVEIGWIAAHPANMVLKDEGEGLLPESDLYACDSDPAEYAARGVRLNILDYLQNARRHWAQNVEVYRQVMEREHFDLVIGDETYEIAVALLDKPEIKKAPFVMIYDFVGLDATTRNPLEWIGIYVWNRIWARDRQLHSPARDLAIFVGEFEDIPDRAFGPLLPNRREYARSYYNAVGYILPFDPAQYADRADIRERLGYGKEPLVICSIGGTAIGRELLELCGRAYPIITEQIPNLRMILVCGPRLSTKSIDVPEGVEVTGFVPALHQQLAACDLAIVQGGGTVTLELTALKRPFLFFPREGDFEQGIAVAGRLARHGAGVRMSYSRTTPETLAEAVIANLGKDVSYPPIRVDGAHTAARLISQLL
jgi:spore coat polysaccharide biosynthesis predicted glycosyltransferase SpsG